ncbi:MAG TPA: Gfo/Idh/MocA family oxidoreductase [Myxococcota bacterium]|nr:Gfo/Idh/MocA family oxidoreductase [Myxococcales bacterium]HPG28030.1 Gfo/Idh/MocA family oxidoreductase [Myxococcota bacterium]
MQNGKERPPIRIALVGHRFMGAAHANAWRQVARFFVDCPFEPVLAVLCGRDEADLARAARRYGFEAISTDWREAVARHDVDVVDVCTPGDLHAPIALAAAAAGKVVLCEKPLANSVAEASRLVDAVRQAGVTNMVCHNYRRLPAVALARRWIEAGRIGRIRHFRGTYLQDWLVDAEHPRTWRLERARAGSGALGDLGAHVVDLARWLVGEIEAVCGLVETFVAERPLEGGGRGAVDVDDAALALLRFEGGAIGTLEATRVAPGRKNHNRFEINGSRGSIAFDLERLNEIELFEHEGPDAGFRRVLATDPGHPYLEAWWPPGHGLGYEHGFTHTVLDLLRAHAAGERPRPDFADALATQRVLEAIERSASAGRWLRTDAEPDPG